MNARLTWPERVFAIAVCLAAPFMAWLVVAALWDMRWFLVHSAPAWASVYLLALLHSYRGWQRSGSIRPFRPFD